MKTTVTITSPERLLPSELIGVHSASRILQHVCLVIFVFLMAMNASSQKLQEYGTMMTKMRTTKNQSVSKEASHLDSLIFHTQPKIYLNTMERQVYGEKAPVCLQTDAKSLSMLSSADPVFNHVELITIKLNNPADIKFKLDMTNLPGFLHLKYVQLLCTYPFSPEELQGLLTGSTPAVTEFYLISLPN